MMRLIILLLLSGMLAMIDSDKNNLQLPVLERGIASPGKRVAIVPAEFEEIPMRNPLFTLVTIGIIIIIILIKNNVQEKHHTLNDGIHWQLSDPCFFNNLAVA